MEVPKAQYEKESKEDGQTFAELNSAILLLAVRKQYIS